PPPPVLPYTPLFRSLWSSMHLRGPKHSFFFGADTGLTSEYEDIARRLGPFDIVALEIGAYHPAWGDIHMGPVNALTAYAMLNSGDRKSTRLNSSHEW